MYKIFKVAPKNWHFAWKNFKYNNKHEDTGVGEMKTTACTNKYWEGENVQEIRKKN